MPGGAACSEVWDLVLDGDATVEAVERGHPGQRLVVERTSRGREANLVDVIHEVVHRVDGRGVDELDAVGRGARAVRADQWDAVDRGPLNWTSLVVAPMKRASQSQPQPMSTVMATGVRVSSSIQSKPMSVPM